MKVSNAVFILASCVLFGCTNASGAEGKSEKTIMTQTTITFEKALAIAEEKIPDKAYIQIEFEKQSRTICYKVKFENLMKVYIDAATGEVISTEPEGKTKKKELEESSELVTLYKSLATKIGFVQAGEIAKTAAQRDDVHEIALDKKKKRAVFRVLFSDDLTKVTIDAETGEVLKVKD